jgi:anaerobic selenocysteine-containing dehydrogenase
MSYGSRDFLMGAATRRDVLMHPDDARALEVADGDEIRLRSDVGQWVGVARLAPMKNRHLQAYWPEANVLIPRRFDPVSGEPDYNCLVTVERVEGGPQARAERVGSMRAQTAPAG